ncbi:MAG: hypothetical protein J6K17_02720 [Oscillospiraceae bacterium]|nr:hypothetical protein [Oscillospiraceae bacterium]
MTKIRIAIVLIVLFIMGIALTVSGLGNLIKLNGNVPDFNFESMRDIKTGDFVQGYVWNIDGCYAYTTTTNTKYGIELNSYTSDEYFVMPLVNEKDLADELYITIIASKKQDRELLYAINDATWEYYAGNMDVVFPDMGIVAKVNELDSEYEQYLIEAMLDAEYYESAAEVRKHIIPYTLTIYNPSSAYISLGIGLLIIIAFAVIGILIYNKNKASLNQYSAPSPMSADNNFNIESKPSENGFEESYVPPQPVPIPDIPQPVQPDEFFARTPKPAAPIAEQPKEEPSAPPAAPEPISGNMDELDTSGLLDDSYYADDLDCDDSDFDADFAKDNDFSE